MSDPLSVISAVVGLVAVSAQLGVLCKQLCDSAKDAPASMEQIKEEMDHLNRIFGQVELLVKGISKKKPSRTRLTMLSLHDLMTVLSGCVLLFSKLQKELGGVAGLVDPVTQMPTRGVKCTLDRIKWALWKEEEVGVMLQDLQRYKLSLNLMLTMIQCNRAAEANESLDRLHDLVERIAESNFETSIQLRELISRPGQQDAPSIYATSTLEENADHDRMFSSTVGPSLASGSTVPSDQASIRTNATSISIRSVRSIIPSFTDELFSSRAYKRFRNRPRADSDAASVFSKDSKATKGDRWSMLSDISLGDLSISEISVLELPICLSDLYDSEPYTETQPSTKSPLVNQRRGRLTWSSGGRLHTAVGSKNTFVMRTLLNLGADIEEKDPEGRTPLSHSAGKWNGFEISKLLLDRGAMVDAPDSAGRTPLLYSAAHDYGSPISKLLLDRGAMVDTPDSSGRTPLSYYAANYEGFEISKLLLDRGAMVDTPDSSGRTPLSYSAGNRHGREISKLLLDRGAMVDTPDSSGRTPLSFCAVNYEGFETSKLLLARGAMVDTPDSSGRTPLSYSAGNPGGLEISKLLLDRGAMADTLDSSGRTPLSHSAGNWNGRETFKLLLDRGAMVDTLDSAGRTPLSYSAGNIHGLEMFKLLLDRSAMVDTPDSSGRTPLSYSARNRNGREISKLLLDQDAMADTPDSSGRTPLSYCAGNKSGREISKLLLDQGAMVDTPDSSGRTPLSYSAGAREHGYDFERYYLGICQLLIDNGAKLDTLDSSGHTPYWRAEQAGNNRICTYFTEIGGRKSN